MRSPLGRESRDLVRELIRTMRDGNPDLWRALDEAAKNELWQELQWDTVEKKLLEVYEMGWKDREDEDDFTDLKNEASSNERAAMHSTWERKQNHGDF